MERLIAKFLRERIGQVPKVDFFHSFQAGRSRVSIRSKNWGTFRLFSSIRNRLIRLQGAYLRFLSCDIKSHWGAYLARVADQTPAKNPL